MKTGIIYISKHGTTEKVARSIANQLASDELQLINLRKDKIKDLEKYDRIIIGGSIHVGNVNGKTKKFCETHKDILMNKSLGLFLCCMEKGEKAHEQFAHAFSEDLRAHSLSNGLMGGEFNFDKMNFFEKAIIKKISGNTESVSEINYKAIDEFVNNFKNNNN
jgi:menaquinone-dependent protoporphyrinogen oxidase